MISRGRLPRSVFHPGRPSAVLQSVVRRGPDQDPSGHREGRGARALIENRETVGMDFHLEICVDSVVSALAAEQGGATRVELCSALVDGGLTPSIGIITRCVSQLSIPVHVLIRPRPGDFCYDSHEVAAMLADVLAAKKAGAAAVVVGALLIDGSVDVPTCKVLADAARPEMSVTFHRAFDMAGGELDSLLEDVIATGADRLLTSGQAPTALEGIDSLECLLRASRGRIAIMAGGGVSVTSAAGFGRLLPPHGCLELHGTGGRVRDESAMKFRRSGVYMGGEKVNTDDTEYSNYFVSSERVHGIIQAATNPSPDGV